MKFLEPVAGGAEGGFNPERARAAEELPYDGIEEGFGGPAAGGSDEQHSMLVSDDQMRNFFNSNEG